MSFQKWSILEMLQSYGLLHNNNTDASETLNKKKVTMCARARSAGNKCASKWLMVTSWLWFRSVIPNTKAINKKDN
jgi:hypothetical protein